VGESHKYSHVVPEMGDHAGMTHSPHSNHRHSTPDSGRKHSNHHFGLLRRRGKRKKEEGRDKLTTGALTLSVCFGTESHAGGRI
jgi:hypothetical protein